MPRQINDAVASQLKKDLKVALRGFLAWPDREARTAVDDLVAAYQKRWRQRFDQDRPFDPEAAGDVVIEKERAA